MYLAACVWSNAGNPGVSPFNESVSDCIDGECL
jgi:hypothetical protein